MPDPTVKRWRQTGNISLWRYRENLKNYPGWHFSADTQGCHSLLELLRLMKEARYPSRMEVRLKQPTADLLRVANNLGGEARFLAPNRLELRFNRTNEPQDLQRFTRVDARRLRLELGEKALLELEEGVLDVSQGKGDYALGQGDDPDLLWLWWWPGLHRRPWA